MRVHVSGSIARLDLTPLLSLLPALRREWAGLRFDAQGRVVNPDTGTPVPQLGLVRGPHRAVGATYRVTEDDTAFTAELRADDEQHIAVHVVTDDSVYVVDIDLRFAEWPAVEIGGGMDVTRMLRTAQVPGCLAGLLGGRGVLAGQADSAPLDGHGRAATATGHVNRFRAEGHADVRTRHGRWEIEARATVHARGLARPVLWFFGRRIRREIASAVADFWRDEPTWSRDRSRELADLADQIATAGGPDAFVHRELWHPTRD